MINKKYLLSFLLVLSLLSTILSGCSGSAPQSHFVSFSQLIAQAAKYNGQTVTLEAFYFSGFEISALSESLGPSTSGTWRIVPAGTLVWVGGGISQELYNQLYTQTTTPSGYTERLGKLKITGKFETGKFGHLDAYQYQITITEASKLDWSPPPATTSASLIGNLQIKVTDFSDRPLQGAKVVSEEQPDGQLKLTGLTDTAGKATFNDIKSGTYKFYINRYDYIQTEIMVTITGGQTTSSTVNLTGAGQAPDDIIGTPGGPAYRANIHQQGVTNPWPPVRDTMVTLDNPNNPAQISYRDDIETTLGQTRNNLFFVTLPNVKPDDTSLPALTITLKAENVPAGINVAQTDLQWHDGDPARRCATAMSIQILSNKPGPYTFNIDVVLNGINYGTVPCTIKVVEENLTPTVSLSTIIPSI